MFLRFEWKLDKKKLGEVNIVGIMAPWFWLVLFDIFLYLTSKRAFEGMFQIIDIAQNSLPCTSKY